MAFNWPSTKGDNKSHARNCLNKNFLVFSLFSFNFSVLFLSFWSFFIFYFGFQSKLWNDQGSTDVWYAMTQFELIRNFPGKLSLELTVSSIAFRRSLLYFELGRTSSDNFNLSIFLWNFYFHKKCWKRIQYLKKI